MRRALVVVPAMAALASCTEGGRGVPAAAHLETSSFAAICMPQTPALAALDGGLPTDDGGLPTDDGGLPDGGGVPDGGVPDGGVPDGGVPDGGFPDGGLPDGGLNCKGINIVESEITFVPTGMGIANVESVPMFPNQMRSASITGTAFTFTTPGCGPQLCNFSAMPKPLPTTLGIMCTGSSGVVHVETLRVEGVQGGMGDFDLASLRCEDSMTGPLIDVAPPMIVANNVPVGTPFNSSFTVTNNGTAPLTFSFTISAGAAGWSAPGSPCLAPGQCQVAPGGGQALVGVRFLPVTHGTSNGTISITSDAGPRSIDLIGNALGSRIAVNNPLDFNIQFGIIARNSMSTRPIEVLAIGNVPVTVTATAPGGPFSVAPSQLNLVPGVPMTFMASCGSSMATGPQSGAITLMSPNAYALDNMGSIAVHCEVANTQVSVAPSAFDFDETRKGTPAPAIPFTIENTGAIPATVSAVELVDAPASLSMSVGGGFPRTLQMGETISGRMNLATDEDLDLAQSAPKLRIAVDGEQLVYPITGKVTTPAAYVTPEKLELGSACVGAGVTATLSMVNSGTARLLMEPPALDEAFVLQLQSPPEYPAPLLAGTMATIGISPRTESPGELAGTLTWAVDAPRSPFVVPVSLALIDTGTAISPASLNFSTVKVKDVSFRYIVTAQNCSTEPVLVTVDGVSATRGGLAAWKVEPYQDARTLAPQDKLTISVAFAPLRHGHHVAQLQLSVDGEKHLVTLEGDGLDVDFKPTSFYACNCNSPRVRDGWPIVLAVAFVVLRRRRRSPRDPRLVLR